MKKIISLLCLFFATANVWAAPELKGNPEDLRGFLHPRPNHVSISDSAEERAYTDEAIVNVVVTTEDDQLAEAIRKNTELRATIRKALLNKGLAGDNIKNSRFSSSPQYGWFGKEPDSYKVTNRMAIRIRDEQHLQDIAGITDEHKELKLVGTQFEHSEKTAYEQKVLDKALEKVMAKKQRYEQLLNIKLIPVAFRESGVHFAATPSAAQVEEVVVAGARAESDSLSRKVADYAAGSIAPRDSFDEVMYNASITVEFKVE